MESPALALSTQFKHALMPQLKHSICVHSRPGVSADSGDGEESQASGRSY